MSESSPPEQKCPDFINSWLAYVDDLLESPKIYSFFVAISTIAAALRRKCYLPFGAKSVYPNFYIILAGPSGCMKTSAMDPARDILSEANIMIAADATTKEALMMRLIEAGNAPHFAGNKAYISSSLTVFSEEFTVFTGSKNPDLLSYLCNWYDCQSLWRNATMKRGMIEVNNVWVNMLGASTPMLLQTTLPQEAIGGGFTSRVIFVYGDNKDKIIPIPVFTAEHKRMNADLLTDLNSIASMHGEFYLNETDNFIDKYVAWAHYQHTHHPFDMPIFAGYLQRRRWHLLKLCMIMSASRSRSMEITEGDFDRALKTLTEVEVQMPKTFSGYGGLEESVIIDEIMNLIATQRITTFKEIMRRYIKDVSNSRLQEIVEAICSSGYAMQVQDGQQTWIEYIDPKKRKKEGEGDETSIPD